MEAPFTKQFLIAFVMIVIAIPFSMMGAVIVALPLGLVGGFMLIKEMINQLKK